ncbi:hypothetical protein PAMP_024131 [Pampus punctatissimus]
MNGKTEITLLKSTVLQGQSFCVGATGKQEQRWLIGTLQDLEFHGLMGARPIDAGTAHYMKTNREVSLNTSAGPMGLCQLVSTQFAQITIPFSTSSGQPVFSLLMSYSALNVCSIGDGGVSENMPGSG